MITLAEIQKAKQRISKHIIETPLIRAIPLEQHFKTPSKIFLKCENFQRTRSFKIRGAFNVLKQQQPSTEKNGAITRSSGNFAQAAACAGQELGIPVTVIMPYNAPQIKIMMTKEYEPELILHGTTPEEGDKKVEEIIQNSEKLKLSPYNHPNVIAGQGTIALEILEQCPNLTHFICCVGGGGLMAGCSTVLKALNPHVKVIAAEPEQAKDFYLSMQKGERIKTDKIDTIADGLRINPVGDYAWLHLKTNVDHVNLVSENEIRETMKLVYSLMGMIIEPSGAVALATLLQSNNREEIGTYVIVISGGNIDLENLSHLIK